MAYKIVLTAPTRLPSSRPRPGAATPPAASAPPARVDAQVGELLEGDLASEPRRIGTPVLREPLIAFWWVRRGRWRVLYEINDSANEVIVHRIERRRGPRSA